MRVADLESITIKLASPEDIFAWSRGEVTKPETINYRTQRAEKDGLFDEKIFGPVKDYECYCGKYRRIRYKGVVCERCGVEVTKSQVRRERMGHIKLAAPVSHIWFLRGVPSKIGMVLNIPMLHLERVIYFAAYIITKVNEDKKRQILEEIEREYKQKLKGIKSETNKEKSSSIGSASSGAGYSPRSKGVASVSRKVSLESKTQDLKGARERAREEVLGISPLKILSELDYHNLSLKYGEIFEAGTGAETLRKIFEKIDLTKTIQKLNKEEATVSSVNRRKVLRRLKFFRGMLKAKIRPEYMLLIVLPILPPDLRPMVQLDGGRYASSDLNDLYRRVINRNNRLKYLLEVKAPEVIVRNEKRMLQEAVDALIDNTMRKGTTTLATTGGRRLLKSLADILKGKQGRFRQNLLGKRVDYSGRSVIVVGPELKFNQVGLPKKMALELFKPMVIHKILEKELSYNVRGASRLIEQETDEVWESLEEVVKDRLILLNRAPTLHRLGIQAFQPILIEGDVISIHPLVCRAFNADFDGDQMAVYIPLSKEAQKEAREIMLSSLNLLKPATGTPVVSPSQDIVLGCYWGTKMMAESVSGGKIFGSQDEAILAYDSEILNLREKIKVKIGKSLVETSAGRILFNKAIPEDFPFINEEINGKKLDKITSLIIEKVGREKAKIYLDEIKDLGFTMATISGVSWGMADLIIPPEKDGIIKKAEIEVEEINKHYNKGLLSRMEKRTQAIEVWQRAKLKIEKLVPKTLPEFGSVSYIIASGARGSWSQPVQMAGMKGLVINPSGQIIELPVKSSYKEGFSILEYFISTHGARKGTADTALRTSTAGYLTRRLVDVAHEMIINAEDCQDKEGILIFRKDAASIGQNLLFKIIGRTSAQNISTQSTESKKLIVREGEIIDWDKANAILASGIEKLKIYSPLSCKNLRGICQKCYGWDLGLNQPVKLGEEVGVVAAQAIGEPGTQLTMRTFHMGGVAGEADITLGLPRVEEIFEARSPTLEVPISDAEGKVFDIDPEGNIRIKTKNKKTEILDYEIPARLQILVKKGDYVKKGQPLSEGDLDLKKLYELTGESETQRYIIKEVQKIYTSQGAVIHDKHLEVIVKQMFSRVRIVHSGDSDFTVGEILEKAGVMEENIRLRKEKKKTAAFQQILLGISKVALSTDSFLSAASFQETSRVLIQAAIEGKCDKLRGLKENVIIGKLIPAGTGFKK
ncbi:DNA-directed RNA polymerase subunit beta' [Patescibacteria group bacterium]|nr:DNA-directed RNA polymerase subunit beta' [Patescibacteria group bacterium]